MLVTHLAELFNPAEPPRLFSSVLCRSLRRYKTATRYTRGYRYRSRSKYRYR